MCRRFFDVMEMRVSGLIGRCWVALCVSLDKERRVATGVR